MSLHTSNLKPTNTPRSDIRYNAQSPRLTRRRTAGSLYQLARIFFEGFSLKRGEPMNLQTIEQITANNTQIDSKELLSQFLNEGLGLYFATGKAVTLSHSKDMPYGHELMTMKLKRMLNIPVSLIKLTGLIAHSTRYLETFTIDTITMDDVAKGFFVASGSSDLSHPWLMPDEKALNHWPASKVLYLAQPIVIWRDQVMLDVESEYFRGRYGDAFITKPKQVGNEKHKPSTKKQYEDWQNRVNEYSRRNKGLSHSAICTQIASEFGCSPETIRKNTSLNK